MSVIKSSRTTSDMEFIATSRNLEIFTIRKCGKIPKHYTFYISVPLANASTRVYECVKKANSIYPVNQHEVQMRRDYFIRAHAELQSMVSQIEVAAELAGLSKEVIREWMALIDSEIRLVKAIMKKDRERYKNIE